MQYPLLVTVNIDVFVNQAVYNFFKYIFSFNNLTSKDTKSMLFVVIVLFYNSQGKLPNMHRTQPGENHIHAKYKNKIK